MTNDDLGTQQQCHYVHLPAMQYKGASTFTNKPCNTSVLISLKSGPPTNSCVKSKCDEDLVFRFTS